MPPIRQFSRRCSSVPPPGRKKALIIGIRYKDSSTIDGTESEFGMLYGPHRDATQFMRMLTSRYDYKEQDVTLMLDRKRDVNANLRPTYRNIMREVMNFTVGAEPGDTYVFYFCGHSGQFDTRNLTEDDGMDEVLLPEDHEGLKLDKVILDNDLRKYLVDPLPVGARLIAVFDSCHSGTLLDLDHYDCNVVYKPWVSKGQRKPRSLWAENNRKNALLTGGRIISARRMTLREVSSRSVDVAVPTSRPSRPVIRTKALSLNSEKRTLGRVTSLDQVLEGLHLHGASHAQPFVIPDEEAEDNDFDLPRCTSPTSDRICDGNCPESPTLKPEVISLSACTDGQVSWESDLSMTQALIKVLNRSPRPTFQALLQDVGLQLHKMGMDLHSWSREKRERAKARAAPGARPRGVDSGQSSFDEDCLDFVNFQDPQLGSQKRLNMLSHFIL